MKSILFITQDNEITSKIVTMFLVNIIKNNIKDINIIGISPKIDKVKSIIEKRKDITVYRYPWLEAQSFWIYWIEYSISFFFTYVYFIFFLITQSFNWIYFTIQPSYYFLIVILCKIFKKKILIDIWDLGDELFCERFGQIHFFKNILRQLDNFMIRNSDVVFVHNKFVTNRIKKEVRKKLNIIEFNGIVQINESKIQSSMFNVKDIKHKIDKLDNKFIVLHRAMLSRKDGALEFLKVIRRFFTKYSENDVIFLQIGKGELTSYFKKFVSENNLQNKLIHIEFVYQIEQFYGIIKKADLCIGMDIDSSFNSKILSSKYIEYTWSGKPIIAWSLPTLQEYLSNYIYIVKNGDIENMVEAIYKFYIDKDLREKYALLSSIAYKRIFSEDVQKEKILNALKKLTTKSIS